jgi:hypothetical protein
VRSAAEIVAAYVIFAILVTGSAWVDADRLLGHPDVDVWNHAWGYWWWWDRLSSGQLPWFDARLGFPGGGVLYFIDPLGALAALPITATLGPVVAWNAMAVVRVAMAGAMAHGFSREVTGAGSHNALAGVAFASTPYLWCELHNGISEVTAVGWVPAVAWAIVRAARLGTARAYALAGLAQGLAIVASFYVGLAAAMTAGLGWLLSVAWRAEWRPHLRGAAVAALVAAPIGGTALAFLRASLLDPRSVIQRASALNEDLAGHNAVDVRTFFKPGPFQSVDLAGNYGEQFLHSGYLRWSVMLLVVVAAWRHRGLAARWLVPCAAGLVLSLGTYLWWNGHFVITGDPGQEARTLLPWGWFQRMAPRFAVAHPLRLVIGPLLVTSMLAAGALRGAPRWGVALAAAGAVVETARWSPARWPIATADARVEGIYWEVAGDVTSRAVFDLPPAKGMTMATSKYLWNQVVHRHPIPYGPDVRERQCTDRAAMDILARKAPLTSTEVDVLSGRYGWIVVHDDMVAARGRVAAPPMGPTFTIPLGEPIVDGATRSWVLRE